MARGKGVQLSIPADTDVEMESIPGCTAGTMVVLITPTTNGALVAAPPAVRSAVDLDEDHVRVTLWLPRK